MYTALPHTGHELMVGVITEDEEEERRRVDEEACPDGVREAGGGDVLIFVADIFDCSLKVRGEKYEQSVRNKWEKSDGWCM